MALSAQAPSLAIARPAEGGRETNCTANRQL